MCLANCELHIPTLTFLIVVTSRTICQRQNQDVKFETSILMTIIASLSQLTRPRSQLTLKVFPGKRVVFEPSQHFTPSLQSSVCILPTVYA